ncbi:MAG TPA: ribonuclease III [Bryobacteraceae bacterium]|nr:ribonuclease III [Bryobacteraceae bacterium]
MSGDLATFEKILGHGFADRELLSRALTHKSRVRDGTAAEPGNGDNEQLEFLGDAVLGFFVTEVLVTEHPEWAEGRLSRAKAYLVSAAHLYEVAHGLGLGDYLLLGRGEEMSGGREKRALLADALEALIAALYLDAGIDVARAFVRRHILASLSLLEAETEAITDYKSALQDTARALGLPLPKYTILEERGPEHAKTFLVEVRVGQEWSRSAEGASKKSAGQQAARQLLDRLTGPGR